MIVALNTFGTLRGSFLCGFLFLLYQLYGGEAAESSVTEANWPAKSDLNRNGLPLELYFLDILVISPRKPSFIHNFDIGLCKPKVARRNWPKHSVEEFDETIVRILRKA
jgi:hypothetical protein